MAGAGVVDALCRRRLSALATPVAAATAAMAGSVALRGLVALAGGFTLEPTLDYCSFWRRNLPKYASLVCEASWPEGEASRREQLWNRRLRSSRYSNKSSRASWSRPSRKK